MIFFYFKGKKEKSLALSIHRTKKPSSSITPSSKASSKALSVGNCYDDESKDKEINEDDELPFISRKIRKMWRDNSGSKRKLKLYYST